MSDLQCSTTMEDEVSSEFRCETIECHTEIRWFVGDTEVHAGGAYTIQQIGYIHRLVIEEPTLSDKGAVTAVARAGTSKLESRLNMKGKKILKNFILFCIKTKHFSEFIFFNHCIFRRF